MFGNGQPFDVVTENPSHPEMTMRLEMSLGLMAAAWLRMQDDFDLADIEASSIELPRLRA